MKDKNFVCTYEASEKNEKSDEKIGASRRGFCGSRIALLPIILFVFALCYGLPALADESRVTLDAERVSFDDAAGLATAEGNAVLIHGDTTIRAGRIDYDVSSNVARAFPAMDGWVELESEGRRLLGRGLEYDLNNQEGVFTGVRSTVDIDGGTLFITGGELSSMPYDVAMERGLIRHRLRDAPYHVAIASDVSVTTCIFEQPHYRLVTRRLVIIPGRRVIARRPRLYFGDTFIFAYPTDYIVRLDREDGLMHSFIPYLEYNSTRGLGIISSGGFELGRGTASLGLAYWSSIGFEWMAELEQDIGDSGFFVRGGVNYIWTEEWREKHYNPHVGLFYERNGWEAALRVAWREYIEDQKDAVVQYRGRLDRRPEFTLYTPWMRDYTFRNSWIRLGLSAGRYWERTSTMSNDAVSRYGLTLQNRISRPLGRNVTFFSNTTYGIWFYDKDSSYQGTVHGFLGLSYNFGSIELMSGYERRFVWGESPMLWDRYSETERLHQSVRIPLGGEFFLVTRGSYDLNASMIDQMNYTLQWVTDCMRWELNFRDDRTSGSDSHVSLRLILNAFPNTPLALGNR